MATPSQGRDVLEKREAVLVRLNKQLDEDARTAISDAERYLRETPVPSRRSGTSSSHRDAAYPVASSSNRRSATSNRAIQSRPNPNDTLDEKMGEKISRNIENDDYDMVGRRHVDSSAWRTGVDGWGGHENSQSEGDRGVPGVAGTSSKGSPPLKVPERLTEAVRATGERKSGGRAGEVSARSDMLSLKHDGLGARGTDGLGGSELQRNSRPDACVDETRRETNYNGDAAEVPREIGEEATIRFFRAKLEACQNQLQEALQAHKLAQEELVQLRKQSAKDQDCARKVSRELQQLRRSVEKENKAKEGEAANAANLSTRVGELERELAASKRISRQAETEKKSLEVRLHRALDEVSKQKEAVRQTRGQSKAQRDAQKLEMSRVEGRCQRLERQKMELLSAFKKQLKLIDIIKRQKFHAEAARVLGFTEETFIKTLDWDFSGNG